MDEQFLFCKMRNCSSPVHDLNYDYDFLKILSIISVSFRKSNRKMIVAVCILGALCILIVAVCVYCCAFRLPKQEHLSQV